MFYNSNINVDPNSNNEYTAAELREYYSIEAANRLISAQHSDYLLLDGSVKALGYNDNGKSKLRRLHNIKSIAAGSFFTCGLTHDGTVQSTAIESMNPTLPGISDAVAIAAGHSHSLGLRADGTVVATGDNSSGQCNVNNWHDIIAISGGVRHSAAIMRGRIAVATKYTGDPECNGGQCDIENWNHNIAQISAGATHTFAVNEKGDILATKNLLFGRFDQQFAVLCDTTNVYDRLFVSYENLFNERDDMRLKKEREKKGVCSYCGGEFKGLLMKKCTNCGRKKNY